MKLKYLGVAVLSLASSVAFAIPTMQIDIAGGSYFVGTDADGAVKESVVTSADVFDLYVYANSDGENTGPRAITDADIFGNTTTQFYLSVALTPKTNIAGDYGSFDINGTTINVTSDMNYGNPPLDAAIKDLAGHSVFDTFYAEFAVNSFQEANQSCDYNVQDNAGIGPQLDIANCSSTMFFDSFTIDKTGLNNDYQLHFDFYAIDPAATPDPFMLVDFAPFSHDAQTVCCDNPPPPPPPQGDAPVPATLALMGVGLLGFAAKRRRKTV